MSKTETAREKEKYIKTDNPAMKSVILLPTDRSLALGDVFQFMYIPGEGLYATLGTAPWVKASHRTSLAAQLLQASPKLREWLTNNPLSVIYGRKVEGKLLVTSLRAGGEWVGDADAQRMTPHLDWWTDAAE